MDDEMEERFPWIPLIKRGFLKSFSSDYEVGTLELLQQNITEEILKVKQQYDSKKGKLLFQCVEYFYYHFCRKWYQWKKFSLHMEFVWVHILSSFLKIGLLVSQGKKKSKWISRVSTALMRFPGEKNLMYDALLSVNCLNKKYQPVYGSILMCLLVQVSSFVPMIINEPAEYLKVCLLFRRLKFLIKDPVEKYELQMKASKILAPSTLSSWLLAHDFNVAWMKRAVRIDLRINIFKKLMGKECEKEVVETIRKILLPRICTERKADFERPFSGLNETDRFAIEGNNIADNFDNMPLYVTDSFKNRNHVSGAYDWVPCKNDKENTLSETEVKSKKMKNKRNYVSVRSGDEVPSAGNYTALNETELKSKKMKRTKNDVSATLYEPLLLEDGENEMASSETEIKSKKTKRKRNCVSADGQEQVQMEKSKKEQQNSFMCNNDFETESKSKKKKQRKEVLITIEKNSEIMHKTTKNRKKLRKGQKAKELGSNSKEIELITISHESDADNLPVIVDEINVSEPVPNERLRLPEFRNMNPASIYSDDEPVIVTEVKHYPFVLGSSQSKKSKPIETELNSNTETKTATENDFVIDAKPSPCIPESHAVQVAYDSEQKGVTCEKSENISEDEKDLNSSVNLADLQDKQLLSETNSSLKNVDKSYTYEETQDSCSGKSSPLKDDQQDGQNQIFCALPVSNMVDECVISEKETSISSSEQTNINVNSQDCKHEDVDNVISPNMEERSGHINQTEEESSRNSAAQTESLNYSSNQASEFAENFRDTKSDLTSEKLGNKSEKSPIQVDLKKETTREIDISQEDVPALESCGSCISDLSSLNDDSCPQEAKVQKDDNASFETDSVELKHEVPLEHSDLQENKSFVQSMDDSLNTNISSQEIEKEKLVTDSSLPNKNDSEVVSNSGSNDSFEVDNPKVLKDSTSVDIHSPSRNNSVHEVTGLFEVKSPVLKTGDSQRYVDENQNLGVKAKIDEVKTPNSSAANGLMENMLKLVELASGADDESVSQNILKGDLPSTANSLSPDFLSCLTSLKNEKSAKCLSFLDISTESVRSDSEIQSFTCHDSKSPEFLQYRDLSIDRDDVRSEDTLSEHKSILKADTSEYPSDASNGTEGEESNSLSDCSSHASSSDGVPEASNSTSNYDTYVVKSEISFMNAMETHRFCKEEDRDESDTRGSQGIEVDTSTKRMLNPVVNLGERCDSKTFVFTNSGASADEEINETKPFASNQAPSTINLITERPKIIEDSPSNTHVSFTEKCDEIGEVINDVKIEIQPRQKDAKELCLTPDQEITVSDESQELTVSNEDQETVELSSEKELSQDQEGTRSDKGKKLAVCSEDQESIELTSDKELSEHLEGSRGKKGQELTENRKENFMLSLSMKLRKRPAPVTQTSAVADEDCSMLNPNSPTTSGRSLRSRNPPPASSQKVKKSRSQTVTRRSSKKLKKEENMNLGFDFSELSLNSPRTLRTRPNESSNKSSSEVVEDNVEPPTIHQENPCRRSTRASVISSNVDTKIKDQDTDPEGYNLRSRKPVIMPGRLKF